MILIDTTCTPPTQRRVLHDQFEMALSHNFLLSMISCAGFAPVSYTWRRWRF